MKPLCAAREASGRVPAIPGYYAIFSDDVSSFSVIIENPVATNGLIYIGIATRSLAKRLVEQDLEHRNPSSFFRSLGATLGYMPVLGSLVGKKNQRNYIFSPSDTQQLRDWINNHLSVSWLAITPSQTGESHLIQLHQPLFNITHNPRASARLKNLRECCRTRAQQLSECASRPST